MMNYALDASSLNMWVALAEWPRRFSLTSFSPLWYTLR
jgi:hypothetical protein